MLKTFSEDLKYFRESKNMTLKDVALDTRLNMAVLENMENGDFTFQPQTYIRAFLRQYAKSIGLSPDGILKDYEQAKLGNYSTKRLPPEEKLDAFEDIILAPVYLGLHFRVERLVLRRKFFLP